MSAADKQAKAAKEAAEAAKQSGPDVGALQAAAESAAERNIRNSLRLEQMYAPEQAAIREQSLNALLERLKAGDPEATDAIAQLRALSSKQQEGSLLSDAIAAARADLAKGGELPLDVQNAVTRSAIAAGGMAGGGQLGMGRAIVPRDLGLTTLALRNQRLDRATQLGQAETEQTELAARLAEALQSAGVNRDTNLLRLASFGQTLTPPESGLSPGDIASLYLTGSANQTQARLSAAQLAAQKAQNQAQLYGGIGGAIANIDWSRIFGSKTNTAGTSAGG